MGASQKNCPFCGAQMAHRLGALECLACGHQQDSVEPAAAVEAEPDRSGPGFKRPWSRPGGVPAPAPGSQYTPGSAPAQGLYSGPEEPKSPTLVTEKKVFFTIQTGCVVIYVLVIIAGAMISGQGSAALSVLGSIIGAAIGISILNWVLFEGELWGKWTCLGCNGFSFLMYFFGMILLSNKQMLMQMGAPTEIYMVIGWGWIGFLFQIAWTGWFMSILWRDIQANKV